MSPFWEEGLPLRLRAREDGRPAEFYWQWRWHHVSHVLHHWRVHTAWWTDREIWRDYWDVTTDSGLLCTLYRDLLADDDPPAAGSAAEDQRPWYLERVYE